MTRRKRNPDNIKNITELNMEQIVSVFLSNSNQDTIPIYIGSGRTYKEPYQCPSEGQIQGFIKL
jgi:hypothetical protein